MATFRPCRLTSFAEESWYYGMISYAEARAVLLGYKTNGQFLVRDVVPPTNEYQYMLSVRNEGVIKNYPVALHVGGRCTLKGLTFLGLEAAVDFFTENLLDGVHLVTSSPSHPWYESSQESSSIGPAIQIVADTPCEEVFQDEDEEETDFCKPMELQTEVTIEATPHHILVAKDRQCEANWLEASPTCGQPAPSNQDGYTLAPPTVTYSTFKPSRSPSPDCVSPSPAASLNSSFTTNSSLLAIWPTRRSFHESRASMCHPNSDSSGEEEDDSNTDTLSECPDEDVPVFSGSDEVSESTLAASMPTSCVSGMKEWIAGDTGPGLVDLSSVSDNQATPLAQVRPSKYVRRSPVTAATTELNDSLPLRSSSATDVTLRVTKPSLSSTCWKSESSFLERHHTLEERLSLKYPNRRNEQRSDTMLRPIPCEFHHDDKDPFGAQSFGSSPYLYTPQSNRHSFVFPQNTSVSSLHSQTRSLPASARRSSQKQRRAQSACFNQPSEPHSRSRRSSIKKSITSLSSLFNKVFRRRNGSVPSQPAPERRGAADHGTTPLRHKMAKEMQSKYSSITRHHWESDSMVVLPAKTTTFLAV